jgi:hypothetical protein
MILLTNFTNEEIAIQENNPILSISPYKTVFNLYNWYTDMEIYWNETKLHS